MKLLLPSLLFALSTVVFSQNAPVSTTTTVLPPYSIHMLENLRSDRDKFIVTVTLRDLTQTEGQVRLRLRMESFTHAMQTRRGAATPIHTLIPGVPLRLTNEDLRAYFLESNLEFTNMPRQLYRNNATVPEGHYRIWFEAYEARTGAHVSRGSEGVAHLHIVQHDVPLINLPQQNATVHLPESGLQHIVFQWAPRHFGPGMLTEYKLQIVEVPPGMNPEQVMHATLVPFFETTTMATSFVFNHTHPPLRLGFTYAFRVQARLRGPDEGMSMFKNNGYTPTQWFTFSQRCPPVRNIRIEHVNHATVRIHYMGHPLHERVEFTRRLDRDNAIWYTNQNPNNQNPIVETNLRPQQSYQYKLRAFCLFENSEYSIIQTFTTQPLPIRNFECGAIDTTPRFTNRTPLGRPLQRGDEVHLPQRGRLVIQESTGTGPYRGWGLMFHNFINANLIMTFEALEVNELYQRITGELISRWDPDGSFMFNLDRPQDQEPPTNDTTTIEVPIIIADNTEITITDSAGNPITDASNPPFTITITDPNGEEKQITVDGLPAVITDQTGTEYIVNREGTVERRQEDLLAGGEEEEDHPKERQKIRDLVALLQKRIREKFPNNKNQFPRLAYQNVDVLSEIVEFDPSELGGGLYDFYRGKAIIGTRGFREQHTDGDITATIYHEYIHHLRWLFVERYRTQGRWVFNFVVECFDKREQSVDEFLQASYQKFIEEMIRPTEYRPEIDEYLDYPFFFRDLNDEQKRKVLTFIERRGLTPIVVCFPFRYRPSSHFEGEVIAHKETLNAASETLFTMSERNIIFYKSEILRYEELKNKARIVETRYNLNRFGYEK